MKVKALLFDVFGTTVDWRSTLTRRLYEQCRASVNEYDKDSISAVRERAASLSEQDWAQFTQEWHDAYSAFTARIVSAAARGEKSSHKTVDEHNLESLHELLGKWQLDGLWSEQTIITMSRAWRELDPWPDSVEGLHTLRNAGFLTCTLSNGNLDILTDMARHASLPWTHIFSAHMFGSYKPDAAVYIGAAQKLQLDASECAMVAAHLEDLEAARKVGMRTIYVERDLEEAWDNLRAESCKSWVDMWISKSEDGLRAVARQLGQCT